MRSRFGHDSRVKHTVRPVSQSGPVSRRVSPDHPEHRSPGHPPVVSVVSSVRRSGCRRCRPASPPGARRAPAASPGGRAACRARRPGTARRGRARRAARRARPASRPGPASGAARRRPRKPLRYHDTCLRNSLQPRSSPMCSASSSAWRRIIARTSPSVGQRRLDLAHRRRRRRGRGTATAGRGSRGRRPHRRHRSARPSAARRPASQMSPLPSTGMSTCSTSRAIASQSA